MKKISLLIQVILVLAVAGLYYLHFADKNEAIEEQNSAQEELGSVSKAISNANVTGGVVFINSDSLLENYAYYKNKKAEFESRQNKVKSELETENIRLQKDVESYQRRAQGMTDIQRQIEEEQLMMRQQKLIERKDELLDKLDEEQAKSSEELYNRLAKYLKVYNQDKHYQFILGFQKGGGILFANDSLDITKSVLSGLNLEYSKESTKK